MLDLQFLCEHADLVQENCRNRGVKVDVAAIVELARKRSQLIVEGDKHRHEQKEIAAQIPKIADKDQRQALVDKGKQLKTLVAENDTALKALETQLRATQRANIVLAGFMTHMCVSATARAKLSG